MQLDESISERGDRKLSVARNSNVAGALPLSETGDQIGDSWSLLNEEAGTMKRRCFPSSEWEEEKRSIPCTQSGENPCEFTYLDPVNGSTGERYVEYLENQTVPPKIKRPLRESNPDTSTTQVLEQLPKSSTDPGLAQPLFQCSEDACTRQSTAQTLGYCGDHFVEGFKEGRIALPTARQVTNWFESHWTAPPRGLDIAEREPKEKDDHNANDDDDDIIESHTNDELKESKVCQSPLCYNNISKNDKGFCSECQDELAKIPTSPTVEKNPKRIQCRGCRSRGMKSYRGLCARCYKAMIEVRAQNISPPTPDRVYSPNRKRSPTKGSSRHVARNQAEYAYQREKRDASGYQSKHPSNDRDRHTSENGLLNQQTRASRPERRFVNELLQPNGIKNDRYEISQRDVTIRIPPNDDATEGIPCPRCTQPRSRSSPRYVTSRDEDQQRRPEAIARLVRSVPHSSFDSDPPVELSYTPDVRIERCRNRHCSNYGNKPCKGYCNECFKDLR